MGNSYEKPIVKEVNLNTEADIAVMSVEPPPPPMPETSPAADN